MSAAIGDIKRGDTVSYQGEVWTVQWSYARGMYAGQVVLGRYDQAGNFYGAFVDEDRVQREEEPR